MGHADWSVKHFRFVDDGVSVVYDWDSLRLDEEPVIVGTAAATFPATWYLPVESRAPTPDEMRLFIAEYEAARHGSFTRPEREAVVAAAVYAMAYAARCEHAVDPESKDLTGGFRSALLTHGNQYFRDTLG